ncbi:ABC-three component system protein, partial [Cytobacillus firmus]
QNGSPAELIQMKHHRRKGSLTDASSDIWKTLRVWSEAVLDGVVDTQSTTFSLITNEVASKGSAASLLTYDSKKRNVNQALEILIHTARNSENNNNSKAYEKFLQLTEQQQKALINNIYILDCSENIIETKEKIFYELRLTTRPEVISALFERLEGIWFDKVIKHLMIESRHPITFREIQDHINDLQEQFQCDNLPIDFLDLVAPQEDELDEKDKIFIEQLRLVAVGNKRIEKAISDYYRAFHQRSKWVRDELLMIDELDKYEERLVDEWERKFEIMKENLEDDTSENILQKEGRKLFNWIDENNIFPIRPNCDEPYIERGSYHMLSNQLRVGWHSQFYERLDYLLNKTMEETL